MGGAEVVRPIRCAHDAPRGLEHGMTFGTMYVIIDQDMAEWTGREHRLEDYTLLGNI